MKLLPVNPRKVLNKAFLKIKPHRAEIEIFKSNFKTLLNGIDEKESEEFHKNLVIKFLSDTWYKTNYFINTKGKADLVIHNGKDARTSCGVLIEVKKPANKTEMPTSKNFNVKATQELLLYYLRERIKSKNLEIKNLAITNIFEWLIFDAAVFEKLFAQDKKLVQQFIDFEEGRLAGTSTDFFYREIAAPFLSNPDIEIGFTFFDIRNFEKAVRNDNPKDDKELIALYKVLSPENLLKLPFANDSNSLDKTFYSELLHIIGLTEIKEGSKKLIQRKAAGLRDEGSLIENVMYQIDSRDKISRLKNPKQFGETHEEQLFSVALELTISWINRILFLKLLEAQLINYHRGDKAYSFLNLNTISDFDELDKLFFGVLAQKPELRRENLKQKFSLVPYLNSSLFEPTELEHKTVFISNLEDELKIPILSSTVLKDATGKRKTGKTGTLQYLFEFLDAYDFASEGREEIQEDNKMLINASVLGLIFEKINGYKDGSFFTPGFITMYMSREAIHRAVVQKFNQALGTVCKNIGEVYNCITDKKEANRIVNSLKICDPAVGSGHFLVSVLNEIIALKSYLGILMDRNGRTLRDYHVEVVNDELIVTDEDGNLFEYRPGNPESQRVQETLFHEKQSIIENCLFGVDINPNSVKICRLRLWIELLKNAYYHPWTEILETLPNIDINIKTGNSLISRYSLDADLKKALKSSRYSIESYRIAVQTYREAKSKEVKHEMQRLIDTIKNDFESEIARNDKRLVQLNRLRGELFDLTSQSQLFAKSKTELANWDLDVKKKTEGIKKLETELEEIKNNAIYENAFEWRFEFPEVLNDDGDFVGFDVVIGNPPYISISKVKEQSEYFSKAGFQTYTKGADIYCLFYELGGNILNPLGYLTYITSNSWLRAIYGEPLKKYFKNTLQPISLLNIEDVQIFEEATVESNIITLQKTIHSSSFAVVNLSKEYSYGDSLINYFEKNKFQFTPPQTPEWFIGNQSVSLLKSKIESGAKLLKDYNIRINFGIKTGLNEAFIIDEKKKHELIEADNKNAEIIKPIIRGRDLKKYFYVFENIYLINTHNGIKSIGLKRIDAEKEYPLIIKHLKSFSPKVEMRSDLGDHWSNLRNCAYLEDFEKEKIIWGEISDKPKFAYDDKKYFAEATTFLMTGEKLKFLLAILNSKVSEWYFNLIGTTTGMGTNRWKKYKIELLPIKIVSEDKELLIEAIVEEIIQLKQQNPSSDTSSLESKIDQLVYQLYGLTEEEIAIVEGDGK